MKSKAIVLGMYSPNGLGVVRSLGIEGIPSVGFHKGDKFPHASYSKYLEKVFFTKDDPELLKSLIEFGKQQDEKGILFCTGDDYALFAEKNAELLSQYYHVPLARYGLLEDIIDKSNVLEIGKEAGFNVPANAKLSSDEVFNIQYPVFLKPLFSVGTGKKDMQIIGTKEELKEIRKSLLENYGEMQVETYIPGPIINEIEIHTYLTSKGVPLIAGMLKYGNCFAEKGFEHKRGFLRKTIYNPDVIAPSNNLTRLLGFKGALDINLKQSSADGKFYFNEVNTRTSANLMIDTKFGLNLPGIIYRDLNSLDFSDLTQKDLQIGKYWVEERRFKEYSRQGLSLNWDKLENIINSNPSYAFFDGEDVAPFYMSLMKGGFDGFDAEINTKKK
ncbi:hypothetical protein HOD29_04210 [archaeon]|jgi:D-aspartate ligase|nr:hypothetical protein [archaeon]